MNEADTRANLIDPALREREWPADWVRREKTDGAVRLVGAGGRRNPGRVDYVLSAMQSGTMLDIALIEAKSEDKSPHEGLEQVKRYGRQWRVPFVFSSNGHRFVEHDFLTGKTSRPQLMRAFPMWEQLVDRYFEDRQITRASPSGRALLHKPRNGDRYYQRAAVRAVLEHIAQGHKRALLSLATGTGKTRIAVGILKALTDSGQPMKALFVCDRKQLRTQALGALRAVFSSDAAAATSNNPEKNARVIVATYQTLGVGNDESSDEQPGETYLRRHYPENYFTHIIIDECHRSGWGKWRAVLDRNPDAVQIGLTATPRTFDFGGVDPQDLDPEDDQLRRDNHLHFGEPIYEYDIAQAMDDGYLAAMRVVDFEVITAGAVERDEGLDRERLRDAAVYEMRTGRQRVVAELRAHYSAGTLASVIDLPDRVAGTASDLFSQLLATGGPLQKTVVFCAGERHADHVAAELNNLYATWATEQSERRAEPYAFKCMAKGGSERLADLNGLASSAFIACTVDLISTGVDVPRLQNIVFLRYINSPILFHQMLGRGTRIDPPSGKLHFSVYDYTNATRLLDATLVQRATQHEEERPRDRADVEPQEIFEVHNVTVEVVEGKVRIAVPRDGKLEYMSIADYRERVAESLLAQVTGLDEFRDRWIEPTKRSALLNSLPDDGFAAEILRAANQQDDFDLYDVLAESVWRQTPRSWIERSERYEELVLPSAGADIRRALARQFSVGGIEQLESRSLGSVPAVRLAGGLSALSDAGGMERLKRHLLATDEEWGEW